MIQQTSLLSFQKLQSVLGERQAYVLGLVRKVPEHTALELAYFDGKDSNYVRPRLTELYKMGLVKINGKRKCKISGRISYVWRVSQIKKSL